MITPSLSDSSINKYNHIFVIWMAIGFIVQLSAKFWLPSGSTQSAQINIWLMLPTLLLLLSRLKHVNSIIQNREEVFVFIFISWFSLSAYWSTSDHPDVIQDYVRNAAYVLTYLAAVIIIYQFKKLYFLNSIDLAILIIAIGAIISLYTQVYQSGSSFSFKQIRIYQMGFKELGEFSTPIQSGFFFWCISRPLILQNIFEKNQGSNTFLSSVDNYFYNICIFYRN